MSPHLREKSHKNGGLCTLMAVKVYLAVSNAVALTGL